MKRREAIKGIGIVSAVAFVPLKLLAKKEVKGGVLIIDRNITTKDSNRFIEIEQQEIYVGNPNITICIPHMEESEFVQSWVIDGKIISCIPKFGQIKYNNSGKSYRCKDGKLRYLMVEKES